MHSVRRVPVPLPLYQLRWVPALANSADNCGPVQVAPVLKQFVLTVVNGREFGWDTGHRLGDDALAGQ